MSPQKVFKLNELAESSGIERGRIRYWQSQGLVTPTSKSRGGGQSVYSSEDAIQACLVAYLIDECSFKNATVSGLIPSFRSRLRHIIEDGDWWSVDLDGRGLVLPSTPEWEYNHLFVEQFEGGTRMNPDAFSMLSPVPGVTLMAPKVFVGPIDSAALIRFIHLTPLVARFMKRLEIDPEEDILARPLSFLEQITHDYGIGLFPEDLKANQVRIRRDIYDSLMKQPAFTQKVIEHGIRLIPMVPSQYNGERSE